MRKAVSLAALMGALLLVYASGVLAQPETPTQNIPDRYLVVFEDGVQRPAAVANEQARENGLQLKFVYTTAIEGYAAVFPNDRARQRVESDPRVDYIEQDQIVRAVDQTLPWGINRVDADLSSTAAIGDDGGDLTNVNAYIIDSGIYNHSDLNVVGHVNFAGGKNTDCNGHGTHVAGTVAAKDDVNDVVGVAPGAPLTGVKVLGCSGSGSTSGVIKGVDWVTADVKGPDDTLGTADDKLAIANMSLGGGPSKALDDAVRDSADASDGDGGIFYSIAAGNDGDDACNHSPARAGAGTNNGVMTVAATNKQNGETSWSNYGPCVDIWAPGYSILSTRKGGGTTTMSGTSMAAPHVGGGGALYLSTHAGAKPSNVESSLKASATPTANKSKDGRTITYENVSTF